MAVKISSISIKKIFIPNFEKKINLKFFIFSQNLDSIIIEGKISLE